MKRNKLNIKAILVLLVVVVCSFGYQAHAQVTVGSNKAPVKGALLEIKNKDADSPSSVTDIKNVTSDEKGGGLGLPRVWLEDMKTLQPFIAKDAAWDANTGGVKQLHAGLMVYNINATDFTQGIYVWDGAQWNKMVDGTAKKYFYIPSFNIPLGAKGTTGEVKLYDEYKKQFTKTGNPLFVCSNNLLERVPSPESQRLYKPEELDYAITYYDASILEEVAVGTDGIMTYKVKDINTTVNSFLNVVFIVK